MARMTKKLSAKPLAAPAARLASVATQDQFGSAIGVFARSWRTTLNQRLKPLGLSQSRWRALRFLSRTPEGLTQVDLARMLGIEAPTVTRLVAQLEQDGLVRRRVVAGDARCKTVLLTPKAKKLIVRINAAVRQLRAETIGRLTDAQALAGLAVIMSLQEFLDAL
jgi:MarR family transcriptional regulator, transcriptional regulator for hemolysin